MTDTTRGFRVLAAALSVLTSAGCALVPDSSEPTATYAGIAPESSSEGSTGASGNSPQSSSTSTDSTDSTGTGAGSGEKNVDASRFAMPGNKWAFRLSGSNDGCWFGASGGTDFDCFVSIDGITVFSAQTGTQREANQVSSTSGGDRFHLTINELGGGHNYDLPKLEAGESTTFDDITCSALGPTSLTCSRGTSSFTYKDGTISIDGQNQR